MLNARTRATIVIMTNNQPLQPTPLPPEKDTHQVDAATLLSSTTVPANMRLVPVANNSRLPTALRHVWSSVFSDLLSKLPGEYDSSTLESDNSSWSLSQLSQLKVSELLALHLTKTFGVSKTNALSEAQVLSGWLENKYGVLDSPLLHLLDHNRDASWSLGTSIQFQRKPVKLPESFNLNAPTAMSNLDAYIRRKWGGLSKIAAPDQILFSELGTRDTVIALKAMGYGHCYRVNGAYSNRGSKTLIALDKKSQKRLLVFYGL